MTEITKIEHEQCPEAAYFAPSYCSQPYQLATFTAFVVFGFASWIITNATYIELGVFLQVLPEKYSIYAYAIFALQSANLYPFLYIVCNANQQYLQHTRTIWGLLFLGLLVCILTSFLWKETATIFGNQHSIAFLILTHCGGLVSATSSVVFYPYVATFPFIYTSALSTGEGISGSLAAFLGLIQAPYATTMRVSVLTFYLLCAAIILLSILGYAFLRYHPWAHAAKHSKITTGVELKTNPQRKKSEVSPLVFESHVSANDEVTTSDQLREIPRRTKIWAKVWPFLCCQFVLAAFSFGILPSLMPYVYKKYAPKSNQQEETSRYQTIASVSALILDPLARLITSWCRLYRVRLLTTLLSFVAIILVLFSLIGNPIFIRTTHGYFLPLVSHVGYLAVYAYTQTMIYLTLKQISEEYVIEYAHTVYQWSGFATQMGALTGTAIAFPLVFYHEQMFL